MCLLDALENEEIHLWIERKVAAHRIWAIRELLMSYLRAIHKLLMSY